MKILDSLCSEWLSNNLDKELYLTTSPDSQLVEVDVVASVDITTAELDQLLLQTNNTQYQRDRQAEYPSIADLVVALYDTDDKSAIETKRAAVKLKYPKP